MEQVGTEPELQRRFALHYALFVDLIELGAGDVAHGTVLRSLVVVDVEDGCDALLEERGKGGGREGEGMGAMACRCTNWYQIKHAPCSTMVDNTVGSKRNNIG